MATLSNSERTTLSLLLRSLSGDVVAIDTLFGVTGGTLPPNTAERASQQNLLKTLAGNQSGIDALFGLTPDGSGNLSTAERAAVDNLLRALSGDPAALDSLSFGSVDPTTLPGAAALITTGRADRGITLGATMLRTAGSAGVVTLTGPLTQAAAVYIVIRYPGGTVGGGVATYDVSLDGGATFVENAVPLTSAHTIPNTGGLTLNFAAATYGVGSQFRATVAQIADYKTGFVFSNATPTQQPILDYLSGRFCLLFDGVDDRLDCTTAGVNAWAQGNDLPYTIAQVTRYANAGVPGNGLGVLFACSTTTGAKLTFGMSTPSTWLATKAGDDGVVTFSGGGGGGTPCTANVTHVSECSSTGTVVTVTADGAATTITGIAQDTATATTLDKLSLGCGSAGGHAMWLYEWACYSGNQRSILQPVIDYLTARYAEIPSGAITEAFYFDTGANGIQGTAPLTQPPNDYLVHSQFYPDVRGTIAPGVTSIGITAIPILNGGSGFGVRGQIGVYFDNAITPTILDFSAAPLGGKTTQTIALDGAAHTVRIDCDASLYSVTGITLAPKAAPNTRILAMGDSITYGFQAVGVDLPFVSWAEITKATLNQATYGFTNFGVQGIALNNYANSGPTITATVATLQALLDGTSKNILVIALGTNDYGGNVQTAAAFQTQLDNLVVALNTAMPALKILLFSPVNRNVETANGLGSTLPNYRTAIQTVATARSTFCTYLEGNGIITVPGDLNADPHPNTSGYAKIAAAVLPAIQAL
jgi:lysophospholipase L1-like esterase